VTLAKRSATSLCLSRARRGRGRLPGAQLHAGVCRGAGHLPERLAGSQANGNVALWRGYTLRVSGNRQSRRAGTPMGQGALHRPQSCRMGGPKVHVMRIRGRTRCSSRIAQICQRYIVRPRALKVHIARAMPRQNLASMSVETLYKLRQEDWRADEGSLSFFSPPGGPQQANLIS
jgi:hypothetical protein